MLYFGPQDDNFNFGSKENAFTCFPGRNFLRSFCAQESTIVYFGAQDGHLRSCFCASDSTFACFDSLKDNFASLAPYRIFTLMFLSRTGHFYILWLTKGYLHKFWFPRLLCNLAPKRAFPPMFWLPIRQFVYFGFQGDTFVHVLVTYGTLLYMFSLPRGHYSIIFGCPMRHFSTYFGSKKTLLYIFGCHMGHFSTCFVPKAHYCTCFGSQEYTFGHVLTLKCIFLHVFAPKSAHFRLRLLKEHLTHFGSQEDTFSHVLALKRKLMQIF